MNDNLICPNCKASYDLKEIKEAIYNEVLRDLLDKINKELKKDD